MESASGKRGGWGERGGVGDGASARGRGVSVTIVMTYNLCWKFPMRRCPQPTRSLRAAAAVPPLLLLAAC